MMVLFDLIYRSISNLGSQIVFIRAHLDLLRNVPLVFTTLFVDSKALSVDGTQPSGW